MANVLGTVSVFGAGGAGSGVTDPSVAHTVGSGTGLVTYACIHHGGVGVTSLETFRGATAEFVGANVDNSLSVYKYVSPTPGTANVVAHFDGASGACGIVVFTLEAVQVSDPDDTPADAFSSEAPIDITIASAVGDFVVAFGLVVNPDNISAQTGSTLIGSVLSPGEAFRSIGVATEAGAASVNIGFTATSYSGDSAIVAFNVNGAAGAGDTPLAVDVGSLAVQGQTITFGIAQAITAGQLALETQDVGLLTDEAYVLPIEHRPLALEGQEIPFIITNPGVEGSMALQGSEIGILAAQVIPIEQGSIALAGQDVTLRFGGNESLVLEGNTLALAGSNVGISATGLASPAENIVQSIVTTIIKLMHFSPLDITHEDT